MVVLLVKVDDSEMSVRVLLFLWSFKAHREFFVRAEPLGVHTVEAVSVCEDGEGESLFGLGDGVSFSGELLFVFVEKTNRKSLKK